jgi:phenylpyruvate tautomerase PptA (4-oxalocrotonate tautomerase family)
MPLIRVELFDFRVNPEVSEQLIAKMTDTLCEVVGEVVREHTWVIVEGHDPSNWGTGGKPLRVPDMPS